MTFNVGNGLATPARLVGLLRQVGADIVGLQEVAVAQAAALEADLRHLYPYQLLTASGFAGKGLLSRHPVIEGERLSLYPDRPDLRAVVDVDGVQLRVLIAHPPPPRPGPAGVRFDARTLAQIEALGALATQHPPALLLGDFNMTPRNRAYARLSAAGLADAFAVAGAGRGWTLPMRIGHSSSFDHGLQGVRLRPVARADYVWYTPPLRAEAAWVGPDGGSDHLPVLARLVMTGD
jgi:endonuclease/exonuclease/phosphatase (EEP) superfamily protein YafD